MYPALMTEYYEASSTSTSDFPGQTQSTIINTSYKSILTCLYNIKVIVLDISNNNYPEDVQQFVPT